MYYIKKIAKDQRNKQFWSSDWHIFHDPNWEVPIWKGRGYDSPEHAAEEILREVNEKVGEDDTLWYLGDMFLNAESDEKCLEWIDGIRCNNIKYIFGNHESVPYRLYKQEIKKQYDLERTEVYPIKMGKIEFIGNHAEIRIGRKNVVMNHFPIHSWNGMGGRKSWMLSGHSHNSDPTRNPDSPINRCLDVGWDWKRSVWSYEEIEDIMSTKMFQSYDHHEATDRL